MDKKIAGVMLGIGCLSMLPVPVDAAVRINEIAWMGSTESSAAEWVELFNTEEAPVDLTGWILSIVGKKDITLSGTIPGKGWFVVARTNTFAPTNANLTTSFGTGISNEGAALELKDNTGILVDSVDATSGWEASGIGGNNPSGSTKQTPQRSPDGTSWNTANPTPGAENDMTVSEPPSSSVSSKSKNVSLPRLYVDLGSDRIISTFDEINPEALVYNENKYRVYGGSVEWAFGDGGRSFGYHPWYIYQYPGEYVVVAEVKSNRLKISGSFIVTVDDADIRISENSERGIGLYNADNRIISLSKWILRQGSASYEIPRGTQILPGRTVIFPSNVTSLIRFSNDVSLRYPNGRLAAEFVRL